MLMLNLSLVPLATFLVSSVNAYSICALSFFGLFLLAVYFIDHIVSK